MTAAVPLRAPAAAARLLPPVTPAARQALRAGAAFAGRWSVRLLVGAAVAAFAVLAAGPHLLGYRTMTMLTASMSPGIDPGDVVVTTPLAVTDVTKGMVISYHIPIDDHRVVTHRVTAVEQGADGSVTVQTKGDANDHVDPWSAVLQGDTAYQVRAVLPEVGHLITALRTPAVNHALVHGVPALLAGWLLLGIWRPEEDPAQDAVAEEDATDGDAVAERDATDDGAEPAAGRPGRVSLTAWTGGPSGARRRRPAHHLPVPRWLLGHDSDLREAPQ
jgi:signal peptidase I